MNTARNTQTPWLVCQLRYTIAVVRGGPKTQNDRSLADIASKCSIAARSLDEEIQFISGHAKKGSLSSALRVVVKTNWRKRRLQRLEKSLETHRNTVETHLLARVW